MAIINIQDNQGNWIEAPIVTNSTIDVGDTQPVDSINDLWLDTSDEADMTDYVTGYNSTTGNREWASGKSDADIGDSADLNTTEKGSLVGAINENTDKISSYIIIKETTGTGSINSGVANFTFPIVSYQGYVPILAIWETCEYSGSFCPHNTSKSLLPTDTSFSLSAWSSNAYTSSSTTAKANVLYVRA